MKIKLLLILIFAEVHLSLLCKSIDFEIPDTVKLSVYLAKAKDFSRNSVYDSAIYYYSVAGSKYLQAGDTAGALKCDYLVIKQFAASKQDAVALSFLNNTGEKYIDWFKSHPLFEAGYLYEMGEKYTDNLKYDSAIISYNRSLPFWLSFGEDSVKQIKDVYKAISYAYSSIGEYDSTIFYLQKSIAVYSSKYGTHNRVAVNAYLALGNAYFSKGEINKGIDLFRKALKTNLSISDFFESDLAWTYNSLGISYYVKKDYNLALIYIRKASELFVKIYSEKSMEVAWCYNNIGICYQEMKDDEEAFFYQDKALKIRLEIVGENHPDVASSYNNLGVICEDKKDYINELGFFKKALGIRRQLFGEMNQDIALTFSNIGSTYMLTQQYDSALWYYDKALFVFLNHYKEATGYQSEIYVHLSQINLALGNYKAAFVDIAKSIEVLVPSYAGPNIADMPPVDEIYNYPDMISALENKANALKIFYEKESGDPADLERCLNVYRLISDIYDRFSRQLHEEGAKLLAEGNAREIFGEAVKVAYRLSVINKDRAFEEIAFYFAEKARASVLAEAMEKTNILHFAGLPDSLLALEQKVSIQKTDCEIELKKLKQQKRPADSSYLAALENKYFVLTSQYQQMIDTLEIYYPVYKYLRNVPQETPLKDILARLDSKTAIFEYLMTGDSLFIFAFNHKVFRVTALHIDSAIKQKINEYPRDIRKLKTENFTGSSNLLYKYLIQPVKDIAGDCERIIIIPDDQLFYIPFESLISGDSMPHQGFSDLDYLIKHYDVSYHCSANLWLHSKSKIPGRTRPLDGFIGFAPVFKSGSHRKEIS